MRGMRGFEAPGRGRNRNPSADKPGSGPGGNCKCTSCGYAVSHTWSDPCNTHTCPKCGATLTKM